MVLLLVEQFVCIVVSFPNEFGQSNPSIECRNPSRGNIVTQAITGCRCRISSARSHEVIHVETGYFVMNMAPAMANFGLIES